eukprot:729026_1
MDVENISDDISDDQTLIENNKDKNNESHERNETNITVTYDIVAEEEVNDIKAVEEEEKDFFPSPSEIYCDRLQTHKHGQSKSLLDELGHELSRLAQLFHNTQSTVSKNSLSFSSKQSNTNKSKNNKSENQRKRRSRSMPSMDELNNVPNDIYCTNNNQNINDAEQGDIISLLSVLVQH